MPTASTSTGASRSLVHGREARLRSISMSIGADRCKLWFVSPLFVIFKGSLDGHPHRVEMFPDLPFYPKCRILWKQLDSNFHGDVCPSASGAKSRLGSRKPTAPVIFEDNWHEKCASSGFYRSGFLQLCTHAAYCPITFESLTAFSQPLAASPVSALAHFVRPTPRVSFIARAT